MSATIVADGESWALLAISAMSGGAGGVLAASADICKLIESGGIGEVFIFPYDGEPGIYLWHGKFDPENSDFEGPPAKKIDASEMDIWLIRHGEKP